MASSIRLKLVCEPGSGLSVISQERNAMMPKPSRLFRWQLLTVVLMLVGYSGYYLCRSNFSVALPLIADELAARRLSPNLARIRLGAIASLGVMAYAAGKFPAGALSDWLGGRRNFLVGMIGSVIFTWLFALGGGLPLFTLAWIGNRFVQSLGWAGMVKLSSRWFSYRAYGTVMGIISLSYLFGDAASRAFMAWLIGRGLGWRGIFMVAGATLCLLFVVNLLLLKENPGAVGEIEPEANPAAIVAGQNVPGSGQGLWDHLRPLFSHHGFWLVCALSLGFTLVRETFNLWTPTYFVQVLGLSKAAAAQQSALFPLFGGLSVLLAGYVSDRLGQGGRAAIIFYGLLLTGGVLFALGHLELASFPLLPVALVALVGFLMIGPYSYLAGAIALDLGGKQGSATTSGVIDGVGYLGGILAGDSFARVSIAYGWRGAFTTLAVVVWLSSLAAWLYLRGFRARVMAPAVVPES
jgi:OPA family glycerol-3-phosphate transporter-like MFS transporter